MNKAAASILRNFHDQLAAAYGPQQWWPAQSALEVIVGAYLTQNTSWRGVERSIANLIARGVMNLDGRVRELHATVLIDGEIAQKACHRIGSTR